MPNLFRGRYRGNPHDPQSVALAVDQYVAVVKEQIAKIQARGGDKAGTVKIPFVGLG